MHRAIAERRPSPRGEFLPSGPERFAFVLVPNFSMIAFASALEPLRIANRMADRELYGWQIVCRAVDRCARATAAWWRPTSAVADVAVGPARPARRDAVQRARRQGSTIARCSPGCAAPIAPARPSAGVHRRPPVGGGGTAEGPQLHDPLGEPARLHGGFPRHRGHRDLFEVDRNRLTCSGGTAALDLMLHLIATRHGQELVSKVSEQCLMDRIRQPHDHQRMPYRVQLGIHHPKLIEAIEMMEANVEEPLDQELLARYVGLSRRQLERLFRKHVGRTPAQYYLERRLERARHLLYQTTMPVMNVAFATGFVQASHFSTCYRQLYGKTPRAERTALA